MPLYEYRCPECGDRFEQLRRMQDADQPVECPQCHSKRPERQLSTFAGRVASSMAPAPCGAPSSKACGTGRFT